MLPRISPGAPQSAWGVSGDGRTIAGQATTPGGPQGVIGVVWRRSSNGWIVERTGYGIGWDISAYIAESVNHDGTKFAGRAQLLSNPFVNGAAFWSSTSAPIFVGATYPAAISDDGRVVTGLGFRWSNEEGAISLGSVNGATRWGCGLSQDGSVIVGYTVGNSGFGGAPFIWVSGLGAQSFDRFAQQTGLAVPAGWGTWNDGIPVDISNDGQVIVGFIGTRLWRMTLRCAPFIISCWCDADVNQDGNADQGDIDYIINVVAGGENYSNIDPDFNRDGNSDQGDIDALINVIAGGQCP